MYYGQLVVIPFTVYNVDLVVIPLAMYMAN